MENNQEPTLFEVLTYCICGGWLNCWTNCWTITDTDGTELPHTFASYEDAETEILGFLSDIDDEIKYGERSIEDGFSQEDFRITRITTQ